MKPVVPIQATRIDAALRKAHRLRKRDQLRIRIGQGTTLLLWLILLALGVDAALGLPPLGLIAIDITLAGFMIHQVWSTIHWWRADVFHADETARRMESMAGHTMNRWINAVQLGRLVSPESVPLRERAVEIAEEDATSIRPDLLALPHRVRRSWKQVGCTLLPYIVLAVLLPQLLIMPSMRLVAPMANLPSFTLLQFEIDQNPSPAVENVEATIQVQIEGPFLPETAKLVWLDESDDALNPIPMTRIDPGQFSIRFDSVRRSFHYYIDTPAGRSGWKKVDVLSSPDTAAKTVDVVSEQLEQLAEQAAQWQSQSDSIDSRIKQVQEWIQTLQSIALSENAQSVEFAIEQWLRDKAYALEQVVQQMRMEPIADTESAGQMLAQWSEDLETLVRLYRQAAEQRQDGGESSQGDGAMAKLETFLRESQFGRRIGRSHPEKISTDPLPSPEDVDTIHTERVESDGRKDLDFSGAKQERIPLEYRELAEQYFRRLAEDQNGSKP